GERAPFVGVARRLGFCGVSLSGSHAASAAAAGRGDMPASTIRLAAAKNTDVHFILLFSLWRYADFLCLPRFALASKPSHPAAFGGWVRCQCSAMSRPVQNQ